jgi:hypothetical protein
MEQKFTSGSCGLRHAILCILLILREEDIIESTLGVWRLPCDVQDRVVAEKIRFT